MKYENPTIRDRLAAEYVLGTMPWRARRRFEAQLKTSPALRAAVSQWEALLTPMASSVPALTPPRRVWQEIQKRIHGDAAAQTRVGWWYSLGFWRTATGFALAALLALGVVMTIPEGVPTGDETMMVVVMDDMQTKSPAMTVSWEPGGSDSKMLRLRVIGHAEMAPDTAWELWMLPGKDRPPVSLGLITTHELQTLQVPAQLVPEIDDAWGLGMTVEPAGGSPSGAPTDQMLYMGQCVKT
ncbi:MAG: anti-sigma factor [Betaproteobacteria bacterium]|nr:MAG: anti-sigma factor [Betaproteobacteria bacterium]